MKGTFYLKKKQIAIYYIFPTLTTTCQYFEVKLLFTPV